MSATRVANARPSPASHRRLPPRGRCAAQSPNSLKGRTHDHVSPHPSALAGLAWGGGPMPDAKAFTEQQSRRVAGAARSFRRIGVLRIAALALGNHVGVTLEAA